MILVKKQKYCCPFFYSKQADIKVCIHIRKMVFLKCPVRVSQHLMSGSFRFETDFSDLLIGLYDVLYKVFRM